MYLREPRPDLDSRVCAACRRDKQAFLLHNKSNGLRARAFTIPGDNMSIIVEAPKEVERPSGCVQHRPQTTDHSEIRSCLLPPCRP